MNRLLLALAVAIVINTSCSSNASEAETNKASAASDSEVKKSLAAKHAIATTAYKAQLQKDIADHQACTFTPDQLLSKARAANGYVGKKIYLEGEIKRISKDAIGDSYAFFKSKNKHYTVKASLRGPLAQRLAKGQIVTLSGTCLGFILSDLLLDDTYEAANLSSLKENLKNL